MKKITTLLIFTIFLTACTTETITYEQAQERNNTTNESEEIEENKNTNSEQKAETELPKKLLLEVPFISQAPHANWDDPYQEACEEASMIMAYNYLQGVSNISPDEADQQILDLVAYQDSVGLPYDISTLEMKEVIKDFYEMNSTVLESESINVEEFKKQIKQGNPIIIPAQGQQLNNPNFTGGGPEYHMLVVIGYDDDKQMFITNDPGTRKGKHFRYSYDTIIDAVHDWTGDKSTVYQGEKRAIIFN